MTPIESIYDVRLVILLSVLISILETLSLEMDMDADTLLAEYLYLSCKKIYGQGEEECLTKLTRSYPLLTEALE